MARKKRQHYTEQFRKEAIRRSEKSGVTQVQVAKEQEIFAQQVLNWQRKFNRLSDKQFNSLYGVDYSKSESDELHKLKRENKRLKEEMEFLKKFSTYFAKVQRVKYALILDRVANIEMFYNRKRRNSANDRVSPVELEEKVAIAA